VRTATAPPDPARWGRSSSVREAGRRGRPLGQLGKRFTSAHFLPRVAPGRLERSVPFFDRHRGRAVVLPLAMMAVMSPLVSLSLLQ
jgi:hypothetical protein